MDKILQICLFPLWFISSYDILQNLKVCCQCKNTAFPFLTPSPPPFQPPPPYTASNVEGEGDGTGSMALYVLYACAVWPPVHRAFTRGGTPGCRAPYAGCWCHHENSWLPFTAIVSDSSEKGSDFRTKSQPPEKNVNPDLPLSLFCM